MLALFERFLAELPERSDRLYILGDLFEAWIGDDDDDPAAARVLAALRRASGRGLDIRVMHGNRDFLLGPGFEQRSGTRLVPDPLVVDIAGEPSLLMHGDSLCTDDQAYQQLRRQLRDPDWQRDFLARPLPERRAMARQLRATSRQETAAKDEAIMDVNPDAVAAALRRAGVRRLIHGHTHRPGHHRLQLDGRPAERIVLGDWYQAGSALWCDEAGCRQRPVLPAG